MGVQPQSEAQQVRNFDKEFTIVVDEAVAGAEQVRIGAQLQHAVEVLQVAVVSHIDGCAGMDEVADEEVGVQVFGVRQRSPCRIANQRVVLQDDAGRQLAGELVIPLAADDVIIEGGGAGAHATQPEEQVRVVNLQPVHRMQGHLQIQAVTSR